MNQHPLAHLPAWRIIPVSKLWLITTVNKCPKDLVVIPFPNGRTKWLINRGDPNHVSKSWDDSPSSHLPQKTLKNPKPPIQKIEGRWYYWYMGIISAEGTIYWYLGAPPKKHRTAQGTSDSWPPWASRLQASQGNHFAPLKLVNNWSLDNEHCLRKGCFFWAFC